MPTLSALYPLGQAPHRVASRILGGLEAATLHGGGGFLALSDRSYESSVHEWWTWRPASPHQTDRGHQGTTKHPLADTAPALVYGAAPRQPGDVDRSPREGSGARPTSAARAALRARQSLSTTDPLRPHHAPRSKPLMSGLRRHTQRIAQLRPGGAVPTRTFDELAQALFVDADPARRRLEAGQRPTAPLVARDLTPSAGTPPLCLLSTPCHASTLVDFC